MRERFDGSLQSSNVPTSQNVVLRDDNTLYRGMVVKVLFVDDKDNITTNSSNPEVLYDVIILGGGPAGQILSNCRLASLFGGNVNYYERVLKATTKVLNKDRLSEHDGDIVFVQFIQGHSGYPIITSLDKGIKTEYKAATKEDGQRLQWQFNGIFEQITKDGEYCLIKKSADLKEDEITWKLLNDEVSVQTFKSGLKITNDGINDKSLIETKGGATVEIDGKTGKITLTKGETIIELDGNSGKIALKGQIIDLGATVADLVTKFLELSTAFNTHVHNAPQAPLGIIPTTPPLAPLLSVVGSQTVKVAD